MNNLVYFFLVFASKFRITDLLCSGSLLSGISILTFQGLWLSWILSFFFSHQKMSFPWEFGCPHRADYCQGRNYENVKLTRSIPLCYIQSSSFICLLSGVFVFWFYFLIFMRIYCYFQKTQYNDSCLVIYLYCAYFCLCAHLWVNRKHMYWSLPLVSRTELLTQGSYIPWCFLGDRSAFCSNETTPGWVSRWLLDEVWSPQSRPSHNRFLKISAPSPIL